MQLLPPLPYTTPYILGKDAKAWTSLVQFLNFFEIRLNFFQKFSKIKK
jgi:hypothetical protein